ncbi:MAG: flagellar motor switch protein FliG [Thiobacillaceae bacterium]
MSDIGLDQSAILLLSLGEDEAAEVLKFLGPREVQKIGLAMANLKNVSREQIEETLDLFQTKTGNSGGFMMDSGEYLRSVLIKALGDDRASHVIGRILQDGDVSGIENLKWMDSVQVADLIRNEHPQIVATILVHLETEQASEVLDKFSDDLRNDVILRIATLDGVQPDALQELNDVLGKLLTGNRTPAPNLLGGVNAVADLLNYMDSANEEAVLENLRSYDAELAQRIQDEMFVFDNLLEIDDRGIQLMLREIQSESLILALKGASAELNEKIFKNMSQRAAEMLREDLESKGPVRLSEVETEQKQILQTVRRLADEGQITLGGKGGEAYV